MADTRLIGWAAQIIRRKRLWECETLEISVMISYRCYDMVG